MGKSRQTGKLSSDGIFYADITNSRVGIGTTIPTETLDIRGSLRVTGGLYDSNNVVGAAGSVLISTGVGVSWSASAGSGGQGVQGTQGVGSQGVQGTQGVGSQGSQGTQGLQGDQGIQGVQGLSNQGAQGTQGTQGSQGTQGVQGLSNQGVQGTQGVGSQGTQGVSGGTEPWVVKTSNYTAVNRDKIIADTIGSDLQPGNAFTITLPASPSTGDSIRIAVGGPSGGWSSNNITIGRNGSNIESAASNLVLSNSDGIFEFVYQNATIGWQYYSLVLQGTQGIQGLGFQGSQGTQGAIGSQGSQGTQGAIGSQGSQGTQGASAATAITNNTNNYVVTATGDSNTPFNGEANLTFDGTTLKSPLIESTQSSGSEGGQINLNKPASSTSIDTGIAIDVYENKVRIFETGGTNRGGYWDVTALGAGVTTNLLSGGAGGATGPTGAQGSQGIQGVQGLQGLQGTQGVGSQGTQGVQGTQGLQGLQGTQGGGGQGVQGTQGFSGVGGGQGTQGSQGITGPIAGSNSQVIFNNNNVSAGATNFVYNATNERVGIGTTNPTEKLTVYNNFSVTRQGSLAGYAGTAVQFGTGTASPSRIVLPTNSGLDLSTGDFTVEFWLKTNGSQSQYATIIDTSTNNTGSYIGLGQNNGGTTGKISFRPSTTGNSLNSATTVTDGAWRHIACVKYGNNAYIFINGVLDASSTGWSASTNSFSDGRIGGSRYGTGTYTDNGIWASLADFRISNTARYTSSFYTPNALINDTYTVLLLDLDTTTPTDLSSNAFSLSTSGASLSTESVTFRSTVSGTIIPSVIVTNVGYVGISTQTPRKELDVIGDAIISGTLDVNGNIKIRSGLYDSNNVVGAAGSVLISTGIGVSWSASAGSGGQGVQGTQGVGSQGVQGTQGGGGQGLQGTQGGGGQGLQGALGAQGPAGGGAGGGGSQGTQGTSGEYAGQGVQGTQGSSASADKLSYRIVAQEGQTVFSAAHDSDDLVEVYLNGSRLDSTEYSAPGGTTVTFTTGVSINDVVNIIVTSISKYGGQGVQGIQGLQGYQGVQGLNGLFAGQGLQGLQGLQGHQGTQGLQGLQGLQGTQGTSGLLGGITYNVSNSGTSVYVINGSNNPTLQLVRGMTYYFVINATGHPFWFQTVAGAYTGINNYTTGVTNAGTASGTIIFSVPLNAPSTLYYVCQNHSSMGGPINIVDLASQGIQGSQGTQGTQGLQGLQGVPGSQGFQGIQGLNGVFAGQGVQGLIGTATGVVDVLETMLFT